MKGDIDMNTRTVTTTRNRRTGRQPAEGADMKTTIPRIYRRILVVAFIGGTLGGLAVRAFAPELDWLAKTLQIIGPLCGAFLFGLGLHQLDPRNLDERQQQVRLDMYLRSFLVLAFVVLVVPLVVTIIYLVSAQTARDLIATLLASVREPMDFVMALVALVPLVGLLPWAMHAWLHQDPKS